MEKHNRKIIYLAGFLFALPVALSAYINSSFISSFIGEKMTGMVYVLGSLGSILALAFSPKIFQKIGVHKFLLITIFLDTLSFGVLAVSNTQWIVVTAFILGLCLNTLIIFSLDELLKIFSHNKSTGSIRGAYLSIVNIAWILAQIASGNILSSFNFKTIYLLNFFIMILLLVVSLYDLRKIPDPKYNEVKDLSYIRNFFKNKNLSRSYIINALLQFFFCWMVIYTPIYLHNHLNFTWIEISEIFAIMLIPFLILPYPLGKYSDKIGERKMLMVGFTITALSSISLFFITTHKVWVWALFLFITRIGAATVEAMSDAYFFKHVKSEEEQFVGVYRSSPSFAYIVGPLLAFITFFLTPSFEFLYLVLGAVMLYGVYLSSTIEKSDI